MKPAGGVVLVVGAGPVGLTAANNLARFGLPVRIIDSRAQPTQLSKALVVWRRSLHALDPIIPHEQWLNPGRQAAGLNLADNGAIFASLDLQERPAACAAAADAPGAPRQHMLPPGLLITQAQIEAGLEQHLQDAYGICVQRSTALESFSANEQGGGVRCVLVNTAQPSDAPADSTPSTAAREEEVLLVSHLIGCDGARSAVRKGLGIPFPGYSDPDNRFLMMDCTYEHQPGININTPRCEAEGKPDPNRPLASTSAAGLILSIPVVDKPNAIRLVWNAGEQLDVALHGGFRRGDTGTHAMHSAGMQLLPNFQHKSSTVWQESCDGQQLAHPQPSLRYLSRNAHAAAATLPCRSRRPCTAHTGRLPGPAAAAHPASGQAQGCAVAVRVLGQ